MPPRPASQSARKGKFMPTGYPGTGRKGDLGDLRWRLPYGKWTTKSGREVIYDRAYRPLLERLPDGTLREGNMHEWVRYIVKNDYTYNLEPSEQKKITKAKAALAEWGPNAIAMGMEIAQQRLDQARACEHARRRKPWLRPPWEKREIPPEPFHWPDEDSEVCPRP